MGSQRTGHNLVTENASNGDCTVRMDVKKPKAVTDFTKLII